MQEVLLSQNKVILALKLAGNNASPRKYLEAALNSNDPVLFHSVMKHVQGNVKFTNMFQKGSNLLLIIHFIVYYILQYVIILNLLQITTSTNTKRCFHNKRKIFIYFYILLLCPYTVYLLGSKGM